MYLQNAVLGLSATELANSLARRHRTALDMAVTMRLRDKPPAQKEDLFELPWDRCLDHEKGIK